MKVAATLDLESADRQVWDAVVVGAGPAGSVAARELARRRAKVLLVDRKPFPRWKVCGACLNGRALSVLDTAGLGGLVDRLDAIRLTEFRLYASQQQAALPLPDGVAVSRTSFDGALVLAAIDAGVEFLSETRAALDEATAKSRGVVLRRFGRSALVSSRVVLAADGLAGSLLPRTSLIRHKSVRNSRIGAGGVACEFPAKYNPGTIFMAVGKHGYVGLVRVEDGSLNIAAAFDQRFVKGAGGVARGVASILSEAGLPPISPAADLPWQGTASLTRHVWPLGEERVLVLGDAAGYVEPFTGEGMAWALSSAVAVAPLARRAASDWRPSLIDAWTREYRRTVARRQRLCRLMARVLRRPVCTGLLVSVLSRAPGLAMPLVRRMNAPFSEVASP